MEKWATSKEYPQIHPKLRVSRSVNLNQHDYQIALINDTLHKLPKKFQDISKVYFHNRITDHPDFEKDKGKVPPSYKAVGWTTKYEDVGGIYSLATGNAAISAKNSWNAAKTTRHEVGHGVWEFDLGGTDHNEFRELYARYKPELKAKNRMYEANDIHEFFAISFEKIMYRNDVSTGFGEVDAFFIKLKEKYDIKKPSKLPKLDFEGIQALEIAFREGDYYIYDLKKLNEVPKEVQEKLIEKGMARVIEVEPQRHSEAAKKGKKRDFSKKVKALRMGENDEDHRSADMVLEVLSWNLGAFSRGKRQLWWHDMLKKFPEIKKYVGETKETDHPEDAPQKLLKKIGQFIIEKEDIYDHIEIGKYKEVAGREGEDTVNLVMKGINVNPAPESLELAYQSEIGAIVEGEIIGANTWDDGDVMINHRVLYEFNTNNPKEILEGLIRFGEDVFLGIWDISGTSEWYNQKKERSGLHQWSGWEEWDEESPANKFIEKIKKKIKEEELRGSGKGKGWWGESERHSQAAKKGKTFKKLKHDLVLDSNGDIYIDPTLDLTEDAKFGEEAKRARTQKARKTKKEKASTQKSAASKRTQLAQKLKKHGITSEIDPMGETIKIGDQIFNIPSLRNQQSGLMVQPGKSMTEVGDKLMTPVMSSIVKAKGVRNNELLLQFHDSQGTYPYEFGSPEAANEAWNDISKGSPGRWVWNVLRGHKKGDPVPEANRGQSIRNPSNTRVIGGKGSSAEANIPYRLVGRVPIGSVEGKEELAKAMREYKMAVKEQIEGAISGEPFKIKEIELFKKQQEKKGKGALQNLREMFKAMGLKTLPKLDYIGQLHLDSDCVSQGFEKYKHDPEFQKKTKDQKLGFLFGVCRSKQDLVPLSEFKQIKHDFQEDFIVFRGAIARSGPYDYYDEKGNKTTLYKDWNNLKDIYSRYDHLPMKVSQEDAHHSNLEGFGYEFGFNEDTEEVEATLVLVNDEPFLDLLDPKKNYHVSPGYHDDIQGDIQYVIDLDHIALSVGEEKARACTGVNTKGASCTKVKIVNHDQNLKEVILDH